MREIKFRAYSPFDKTMYYLTGDAEALAPISYELGMWLGGWEIYAVTAAGKQIVLASETRKGEPGGVLMQYTGLKDKNGLEVYEGDIISDQDSMVKPVMEVYWRLESGAWWTRSPIDNFGSELHQYRSWMEVIGNIYENPELLK